MTARHLFNMKNTEGRYLIGVSGGPDSMALLDMCRRKGMDIWAAHVNYQARESAGRDEEICRGYCAGHNINLSVLRVRFDQRGNFEDWARQQRFGFFRRLMEKTGADGILLAHQKDDHLETYLLQKEKGSVPLHWGLQPESEIDGLRVFRPLLNYDKKELIAYCRENGVEYGWDETNDSRQYARNRIRHEILAEYSEKEKQALLKEIEAKNSELDDFYEKVREAEKYLEPFRRETYLAHEKNIRLQALRQALIKMGLPLQHVQNAFLAEMDEKILQNKNAKWPFGEKTLYLSQNSLHAEDTPDPYRVVFEKPAEKSGAYFQTAFTGKSTEGVFVKEKDLPLIIRSSLPGDFIDMRFGRKKISRFFIDRHIDLYEREIWPVVVNREGKIILVPGLGCDKDHYALEYNFFVKRKGNLQEDKNQV